MFERPASGENVVVVQFDIGRVEAYERSENLNEIRLLTQSAGGRIVGEMLGKRSAPDPATFAGKGKVAELAALVSAGGADGSGLQALIGHFESLRNPHRVQALRGQPNRVQRDPCLAALPSQDFHGRYVRDLLDDVAQLRAHLAKLQIAVPMAPQRQRQVPSLASFEPASNGLFRAFGIATAGGDKQHDTAGKRYFYFAIHVSD